MPLTPPAIHSVTEGWTEPLDDSLLIADAVFNAQGFAITGQLRDKHGQPVTDVSIGWADATISKARLTPSATTFKAASAPYRMKYKVTDDQGNVTFFPQTDAFTIDVYPF